MNCLGIEIVQGAVKRRGYLHWRQTRDGIASKVGKHYLPRSPSEIEVCKERRRGEKVRRVAGLAVDARNFLVENDRKKVERVDSLAAYLAVARMISRPLQVTRARTLPCASVSSVCPKTAGHPCPSR